jgi:hypothetical protein
MSLTQVPSLQIASRQQGCPSAPHVQMPLMHPSPKRQVLFGGQQGRLLVPHAWQVPFWQKAPPMLGGWQAWFVQHGSPTCPQATQLPAWQRKPLLHVLFAQQGSFVPPQATQTALRQIALPALQVLFAQHC